MSRVVFLFDRSEMSLSETTSNRPIPILREGMRHPDPSDERSWSRWLRSCLLLSSLNKSWPWHAMATLTVEI